MAKTKETTSSTVPKKTVAKKASKVADLSEFFGEIEKKSYEIYLERVSSGSLGNDYDDWIQAEKIIKEKHGLS